MKSLKDKITEDVRRIVRYPSRANLKIPGADARRVINALPDLDLSEVRSLREYLTAMPALSEHKVEVRERDGLLKAYNIACDTPKKEVLFKTFGPELSIRYRIVPSKNI